MLTVFNVGQGDSFLLTSHDGCIFNRIPLLIDTGAAGKRVVSRVSQQDINVMITHSHTDHIGGLPRIIASKSIKTLFLPYYLPEVTKINGFLKKHSKNKIASPNWKRIRKLKIKLVSQGDAICKHLVVYNPPRQTNEYFWGDPNIDVSIETSLRRLTELGIDLPTDDIINYKTPILPDEETYEEQETENYRNLARKFVHAFFNSLSGYLSYVTRANVDYYITRHIELTSNQTSIVFKYCHTDGDWLFTGDADESVFERLMSQNENISAKYLKVPHHGSRENISESSLTAINPSYGIVSHDNKKFGRSKDSHPHHEIIDLIDKHKVTCFYTNPVIKDKQLIKEGSKGPVLQGLINFI